MKEQKRIIKETAIRLNCSLLKVDMRSNFAILKRGTKVWRIAFARNVTNETLRKRIIDGLVYGQRLDLDPTSEYYQLP